MRALSGAARSVRRVTVLLGGAALVASAVFVGTGPAAAATVSGFLGVRGAGGLYAGNDSSGVNPGSTIVTRPFKAGKSAQFSVEIRNTGSADFAYQLNIGTYDIPAAPVQLLVGKTDVASQALQSSGYVTDPIKPGKSVKLKLVITPGANVAPGMKANYTVRLFSPGGATLFGTEEVYAVAEASTGTQSYDAFTSAAGQPAIPNGVGTYNLSSAPAVKQGKKTSFVVTLENDSANARQITFTSFVTSLCSSSFTATYMVGKTNITPMVTSAYVTPMLDPGDSVKIKITVLAGAPPADPTSCLYSQGWYNTVSTSDGSAQTFIFVNGVRK